jgi:division protein CdvB (Snf7/Vps24/ESCRT-III family)
LAGVLQKSTEVMKAMNNLMKLPQLSQTLTTMAREMEKAGLIEEMVEDALDNEDIEDDVEEEVNKVHHTTTHTHTLHHTSTNTTIRYRRYYVERVYD